MFEDRSDAGTKLGRALEHYRDRAVLVCAIPRGGVEVGFHVASHLHADFSIIVSRKLPFPCSPESGFGAIAEDGSVFLCPGFESMVHPDDAARVMKEQRGEIRRRVAELRSGRKLPRMKDRTVILVDDGIAMGSTMRVSIALCRKGRAGRLVVAVPVAGRETAVQIGALVDEIMVLEMPPRFMAVAQVYRYWHDVSDEEVCTIMERWQQNTG